MELWDIYDIDRINLNKTHIRGKDVPNGEFHLVVHVAIFNDENKMLIQQRTKDKSGYPNLWDITCGGSCLTNETSQQGVQRELFEELGIEHDFSKERSYLTINFSDGFDDIYLINKNVDLSTIVFQKSEVQAAKYASKEEILEMIDDKSFIPYKKSLINLLFEMNQDRGSTKNEDYRSK